MTNSIFITTDSYGTPYLIDCNYFPNKKAAIFQLHSSTRFNGYPVTTSIDGWKVIAYVDDTMYQYHWSEFLARIHNQLPELFI